MAKNLVISNSSFSLIGAYLNSNKNKSVVYPANWFGYSREVSHYNVKDIAQEGWIPIHNKMSLYLQVKANWLFVKELKVRLRNAFF